MLGIKTDYQIFLETFSLSVPKYISKRGERGVYHPLKSTGHILQWEIMVQLVPG